MKAARILTISLLCAGMLMVNNLIYTTTAFSQELVCHKLVIHNTTQDKAKIEPDWTFGTPDVESRVVHPGDEAVFHCSDNPTFGYCPCCKTGQALITIINKMGIKNNLGAFSFYGCNIRLIKNEYGYAFE